ncbi:MAG: DUF2587 domain-containing protein [Acidimicrobiia bacterium]|nr:DUF2587 domain-containing protein [Acidimicrobiia bacterium]
MTSEEAQETQAVPADAVEIQPVTVDPEQSSAIRSPSKLIRIASMTLAMLEEVRQAPLDDQGRTRLAAVHGATLDELRDMLPEELLEEFNEIMVPLDQRGPSEAELRIAQAQLIGWLEGLFHGIQASLFSQQMAAQAQLQEMQRRALGKGGEGEQQGPGLYL